MNIEHRIYINAPVQQVFQLLDDGDALKLWMEDLLEMKYRDGGAGDSRLGVRFTQRFKEGGRVGEYAGEVIAYEPLRHLALRVGNRDFTLRIDYQLVADAGQTRLDYRAQMVAGNWFMRLTGKLFEGFTRRILHSQMWRLKTVAEACVVEPTAAVAAELLAA